MTVDLMQNLLDSFKCHSVLMRRYGSAACDLKYGHSGLHRQYITDLAWTDADAERSLVEISEL